MGRSIHLGGTTRAEECIVSSAAVLIPRFGDEVRKISANAQARSLRVLTLTPFFPSIEDPGQGGFIAEPLAMMEAFDIANEVIVAQPFYRRARHAKTPAVTWKKYFSIPGNAGLCSAGAFLAASILPTILKKHRETPFDVIHAHAALPCGHAAEIVSNRLSVPFVVSVHGLDAFFTRQAGTIVGRLCKRVAKRVYRSASTVICISEKVRERVIAEAHADVTVIQNGVDVKKFLPEKEPPAPLSVLSVGNLISIKGHALLLRAFARVLPQLPDSSLEIIGDGPEKERLGRLAAKLGIAHRVRFSGRHDRDHVSKAMRRCAVFALPSNYEGLGCVYLEAMACAKPAIACRGQGIEEIIEHGKTGMLITPESEHELAEAMLRLLRDKELCERMGENARAVILDRVTLTHQAQRMAEVYRRWAQ